ncbi:MAG: HEAT repeat domain-containing protein [Myxococcota bacterium]
MPNRRRCGPWRWVFGLLLATACREPTPTPTDSEEQYVLTVEASGRGGGGRGQGVWAQEVVRDALSDSVWFRARGSGPQLSASVVYEERELESGIPVLRVQLTIDADAKLAQDLASIGEEAEAYVELENRDQTIDLRRDLPYAVERAISIVDTKVTTARGDESEVGRLLEDKDPEVIIVALAGIRQRRWRALGDAVFALTDHQDPRVAIAAVHCLGAIGGPEHAPGMLRAARLADRAHANRLYEALANLGGEHARGFLEFAARNEDDPEMADIAERALAHLESVEPAPLATDSGVGRGHRQ